MRYAIVSDIHSNLQAWNAVLFDIRSLGIDRIICLGDIVGYGPNPVEVLESVYSGVDHFVLGNHDAVVCGKLDDSLFNDSARTILDWTRGRLGRNAARFLSRLPLALDGGTFRCTHGDFSEPAYFNYIEEPKDAVPSWSTVGEQLLFAGHTHVPAIFLLGRSGTPHVVPAQDFVMEPEKRYLVNPGSVGQPRDGDARASYCIYDQEDASVCWRRIPFDVDAYRNSVTAAGIPIAASHFLDYDPRKGVPPLREMLSFSPPKNREKAARDVVPVHTLEVLQKRVRKLAWLSGIVSAALIAVLIVVAWAWFYYGASEATIDAGAMQPAISASTFSEGTNMLSLPAIAIPPGRPIPGWTISLSNRRGQHASVETAETDGVPILVMKSDGRDIRLSSQSFDVEQGMKFQMEALFKHGPKLTGDVWIGIELTRTTPNGRQTNHLYPKAPVSNRKDGWASARGTFTLPAGSTAMRFEIYGKFKGRTIVRNIQLKRKPSSADDN